MDTVNTSSFLQEAIKLQLDEGSQITLCVTGRSMRPYLSGNGDESIIVSKHKTEELKPGVIILFFYNNKYIFHRIIGKKNDTLVVLGDGNCVAEKTKIENVLGIVRHVIRAGGKKVSSDSFTAQVYWRIWYILRPIRKYLLYLYNKINK